MKEVHEGDSEGSMSVPSGEGHHVVAQRDGRSLSEPSDVNVESPHPSLEGFCPAGACTLLRHTS